MLDKVLELFDNLYSEVISSKDIMCKLQIIRSCKFFLDLKETDSLSDYYYKLIFENKKGIVYTPLNISNKMVRNTIVKEDIINNPFIKILDPSCGGGNIILPMFDYLRDLYLENLDEINIKNCLNLNLNNINEHIVKNNIYGIDLDSNAIKILIIELFNKSSVLSDNFSNFDFLLEDTELKYNIIIGNPPYLSTKAVDRDYSKKLREFYKEVYYDKADLSYCFFKRALDKVVSDYKITFITSRYFMEALHGEGLRKYLIKSTSISKIIDFYGIRPFKNKGIDPVIIFLSSKDKEKVEVSRPLHDLKKSTYLFDSIFINKYSINSEPWRLISDLDNTIISKIERKAINALKDICNTNQGIITGCDKAFIVDEKIIDLYNIEKELLKPWIKGKDVKKNIEINVVLYLIYSNIIDDEKKYPNAIKYISQYKHKLMERRECKNKRIKWYELQWGRNQSIFERKKIIFPYKSSKNIFIINEKKYFSADIYSLQLNSENEKEYEKLAVILNSELYEFYFKSFAKKLGGNLFEYYPNNINRLRIPVLADININNEKDLYQYFEISKEEMIYIKSKIRMT